MMPPERLINAASRRSRPGRRGRRCSRAAAAAVGADRGRARGLLVASRWSTSIPRPIDATDPDALGGDRRLAAAAGLCRQGPRRAAVGACATIWGNAQSRSTGWRRRCCCRARRGSSRPTPNCRSDAPDLIASMLAGGLRPRGGALGAGGRRNGRRSRRPVWAMLALGAAGRRAAGDQRRPDRRFRRSRPERGQAAQRAARRRASPGSAGSTQQTAGRLNRALSAWACRGDGLDRDDRRRVRAAAAGHGRILLAASGCRRRDSTDIRARLSVPRGHRAQAHRPGICGADDRRRGAGADVSAGATARWSTASST